MRRVLYSAYELGLHRRPRRDVLDLGTGCGYFPFTCRQFGHRAVGTGLDDTSLYDGMTAALGLDRRVVRVSAFEPLPDFGRRFDLVTAFAVCFNRHGRADLWGPAEWHFFLADLTARHLKPGGRVALRLNREADGTYANPALAAFRRAGATVDGERVAFASLDRVGGPAGAAARAIPG